LSALAPAQPRPQRRTRERAALRLLAAGLGLASSLALLGVIWPESDRSARDQGPPSAADLAEPPSRAISVLLIGSDADQLDAGTATKPANSDALLLVQVNPEGPLQLLSLPVEAAVQLPGDKQPVALGSLYKRGGPALVAGAAAQLVGLPQAQPDRYVVLPRAALRDLVDGIGRVELSPDRSMRYTDKTQKYTIRLEGGLQVMDGQQVEQLLRFRDEADGEERRRDRQQMAVESVLRQMAQRQQLQQLPDLLQQLQGQVETNLTRSEALSLLAVALRPGERLEFRTLPLQPPLQPNNPLRALDARAQRPWPN
jgi:LCP family protein required for cell wall assembly